MFRKLLAAAALASVSLPAYAQTADEILGGIDAAARKVESQIIKFRVLNKQAALPEPQVIEFMTRIKDGKSYTEFLAPGDLKGTRALTLSPTQMWVYMPDFGKIRKISSHNTDAGFMGTTLTQQDMGVPSYSTQFDATIVSQTDESWVLSLTAKDGIDVTFPRMNMTVSKEHKLPTMVEYLGAKKDDVLRTQTIGDYTCDDVQCMFGFMKMVDHRMNGAWTEVRPLEVQLNVEIPDDLFTPRSLQLGL